MDEEILEEAKHFIDNLHTVRVLDSTGDEYMQYVLEKQSGQY
jgi:hypothetical protein